MPLRLIEMVLPEANVAEAQDLLKDHRVIDVWYDSLSEHQTLIKILVPLEETEPLIDALEKQYQVMKGFRLILLPVVAAVPRPELLEEEEGAKAPKPAAPEEKKERASREELYTQITDTSRLNRVYLAMVLLSAIVAAIGILNDNVAVVIGAMVIAPLLGPNVGLSLATTLGDIYLAKASLKANAAGLLGALGLSMLLGLVLAVDPATPQIAARANIGLMDVVLALAAGSAGALAFTSGAPAAIVGVMVAVALLPPVVTLGLLVGSSHFALALGAMLLVMTNIICVNLAGVVTFLVQGVRPITWWEAHKAKRATRQAIMIWVLLLGALILIIMFSQKTGKIIRF